MRYGNALSEWSGWRMEPPHAAELQRDAPNYTNIQPVVQISEVMMG